MKEYEILEIKEFKLDNLNVIKFKNPDDALAFMNTALLIDVTILSFDRREEFTFVEIDRKAFAKLSKGLWIKVSDPIVLGK